MSETTPLGKHFTLEEMCKTSKDRYQAENNRPSEAVVNNLTALVKHILDPLRERAGAIRVSSGYRCPLLNKAVGGVSNSQHVTGEASDIQGIACSNAALFNLIREMNLPFDQLIWEYGTEQEPAWVHVSYSKRNRRQVFAIGVNKKF